MNQGLTNNFLANVTNILRHIKYPLAIISAGSLSFTLISSSQAQAQSIVLDFEGLQNLEPVAEFYNGSFGGSGSGPGTNFGVEFSNNSLAIIDGDAGGSGNFGGEPSPDTVLFFLNGTSARMNVPGGFDTGFSFFYSAINNPGFLRVYDELNGTGNILAEFDLPLTPTNGQPDPNGAFSPLLPVDSIEFQGVAKSVDFGGVINQIAFDDITFGSTIAGDDGMTPIPTLNAPPSGRDFVQLSNGSSTWNVVLPQNSLAGQTRGANAFTANNRVWGVPHSTGMSRPNGSNLSIISSHLLNYP